MGSRPTREHPPEVRAVPRVSAPDRRGWRDLAARGPCVITDALGEGVAARAWTLASLRARVGDHVVPVEYSVRPIFRPDPRLHGGRYLRREMTFAEAIDHLIAPPRDAPHHYVSTLALSDALPALRSEVGDPTSFHPWPRREVFLFAGGTGSGSQTHYDLTDNFVAVFEGCKRVWLLPPGGFDALHPWPAPLRPCHFSRLRDGLPASLPRWECALAPGDLLYIPAHWWHYIENVAPTLGVTYSHPIASARDRLRWRHARVALSHWIHNAIARDPGLDARVTDLTGRVAWHAMHLVPARRGSVGR